MTTVDAVNGLATLARQPESVKQVAVADRLILTKTDVVDGEASDLVDRLAGINPSARVLTASFGAVEPERLFDMGPGAAPGKRPDLQAWLGLDAHAHHRPATHGRNAHDPQISCFAILREEPIRAVTLTPAGVLAEHCGGDLLALKGIVNVAESPDRPAVIHGVQHLSARWLKAAIRGPPQPPCFIVRDIPRGWIEALRDTGGRSRGKPREAPCQPITTHRRSTPPSRTL